MQLVVQIAMVCALAAIAFELGNIRRSLARLSPRLEPEDEASVPPAHSVTVNIGSLPGGGGPLAQSNPLVAEPPVGDMPAPAPRGAEPDAVPAAQDVGEPEPQPERRRAPERARPTESGMVAKRCPACGLENSSFRTECFNCGGSLD